MKRILTLVIALLTANLIAQEIGNRALLQEDFYLDKEFIQSLSGDSGQKEGEVTVRDFDDKLQKEFRAILEDEFNKVKVKGISVAVIAKEGIWRSAVGISSYKDSLDVDMVFGMGSVTKSVTAALILKLEDKGILSIQDSIGKWLPPRRFVDGKITIRQLLNHTSGIYNITENPDFVREGYENPERIWKPEEVLDSFLKEPYFEPGTDWHYSNSNYILAGMIIEKATGGVYHKLVREKLLHPYGLDSLYLKPFESNSLKVAHFWADITNSGFPVDITGLGYELKAIFSGAWAAGGYMSRPVDAAMWMRTLVAGSIFSKRAYRELLDGVTKGDGKYYGLGVGYYEDSLGRKVVIGHDGYIGYVTKAYHFPQLNLTVAVQSNDAMAPGSTMRNIIERIVLAYTGSLNKLGNESILGLHALYPNPAGDIVHLDFGSAVNGYLKVYDINGHRVKSMPLHGAAEMEMKVADLVPGLYFLKVNDNTGKILMSAKFIKGEK